MRVRELLREAWIAAITRLAPTLAVAVLAAAMCVTTLTTVGRTAAAEAQILARLDSAGARLIVVTDAQQQGLLTPAALAATDSLDTVERSVGLTSPVDVVSGRVGAGGTKVPTWRVLGDIEQAATLTAGRWPAVGEVVVSERALRTLGLDAPIGYVTTPTEELAVVGTFTARPPFDQLDVGAIGRASDPTTPATTLSVVVDTADQAAATQQALLGIVAPPNIQDLTIQSPATLAQLQADLGDDIGRYGSSLTLLVLGAGAALVAVVVLVDVLVRRSDLGRRRALGASRSVIVGLVVLRTAYAAGLGAVLGVVAGWGIARWSAVAVPWDFAGAVGVLALLCAVAASAPFAVGAARQDPVRILRTP